MNYFSDSSEWKYLFRNAIDWDHIIPLYHPHFPTATGINSKEELLEFYEELLTATGKWASQVLAPRASELDTTGGGKLVDGKVVLSDALQKTYREAKDMDLFGIAIDPRYGGLGVSVAAGLLTFEHISRACFSTSTQLGFFSSIADMLERFCDPDLQNKYIPMIQRGEISGCMCLTEPDAGSDVGSLRTVAKKQSDGTYLLNGSKCFITNGCGGIAFILARIQGAPAGLAGVSMFFSEEWISLPDGTKKQNYRVSKLEEKMGLHGSITCEIVYEDTVARLVGKENDGFNLMLHLMNEARLCVGLQGLGGMEISLEKTRAYAETRKQFGKPIIELPLFRRNLQDWETERDAFRVLMVDTISYFDIFQKLHLKKMHSNELSEKETALYSKVSKVVRRRTPLVKFYGAEANARITQRAIQAFGGYGFMKEYEVERFHRDSFGALLYEGTSQIQSLMAMKDFVKRMMKNPGKFIQSLVIRHPLGSLMSESEYEKRLNAVIYEFRKNVAGLIIRCFKPELSLSERSFRDTITQINQVFKREYWQEAGRFDKLMCHAETLCEALSYCECLEVLAKHAVRDPSRGLLYHRYLKLIIPRLAAIYADWKV